MLSDNTESNGNIPNSSFERLPPERVTHVGRRSEGWRSDTYKDLIKRAIEQSPQRKMKVAEIYQWFREHFGSNLSGPTWQNTIRHTLTVYPCFAKEPLHPQETVRGAYWKVIDPSTARQGQGRVNVSEAESSRSAAVHTQPLPTIVSSRHGTNGVLGDNAIYSQNLQQLQHSRRNQEQQQNLQSHLMRSTHDQNGMFTQYAAPNLSAIDPQTVNGSAFHSSYVSQAGYQQVSQDVHRNTHQDTHLHANQNRHTEMQQHFLPNAHQYPSTQQHYTAHFAGNSTTGPFMPMSGATSVYQPMVINQSISGYSAQHMNTSYHGTGQGYNPSQTTDRVEGSFSCIPCLPISDTIDYDHEPLLPRAVGTAPHYSSPQHTTDQHFPEAAQEANVYDVARLLQAASGNSGYIYTEEKPHVNAYMIDNIIGYVQQQLRQFNFLPFL